MKRTLIALLIIFWAALFQDVFSQTKQGSDGASEGPFTYKGLYDTVFDRYGNKFALRDLQLGNAPAGQNTAGKPPSSPAQTNSIPSMMCSAGYFDLYFATNSCFDGMSQPAVDKRNVACQLFTDISGFINTSYTGRINILCDNTSTAQPFALGTASSFYVFPSFPTNPNQGIIDNQIHKAIISGQDPFATLPISVFPGANNFYYGYVNANPNPPLPWSTNLATTNINAMEFDLYTVLLHEVTHALGFASMIDAGGISRFGAAHNMFTRFDKFLYNASGSKLLGTTTPPCDNSNVVFAGAATDIAPGGCVNTGANSDNTACGTAVKYIGSTNVKIYTPNCYEPGSSLSHFEDICTTPGGFSSICPATPPNNNLYYVMTNAQSPGNCYVKRHLQPEERLVLCDLGYNVNNVYNSPVAGAQYSYPGPGCTGTTVFGINDGLSGNTFAYTTALNTMLSLNIGTQIINNDGNTTKISCAEEVYGNASLVITGTGSGANQLQVTPNSGYTGLLLIKYSPQSSTGEFGNSTYIYVYVLPGNCNPVSTCDMVQNGGFEGVAATSNQQCAWIDWTPFGGSAVTMDCWNRIEGTPDLFTRGCLYNMSYFNLGTNTYGTVPPTDAFINPTGGIANNRALGLGANTIGSGTEAIKNNLSAPLVPGQTYKLSFWIINYSGPFNIGSPQTFNASAYPIAISFASSPNYAIFGSPNYPTGLNTLASFTVPAGGWTYYTTTFVFNPSVPASHSTLLMGIDLPKTFALAPSSNLFCWIDEVSLVPVPNSASFVIPQANACGNSSVMNLNLYASVPGKFSGTGVTLTGTQYDFNASASLPPGNYPVCFSYTINGCANNLYQNITVQPAVSLLTSGSGTYCSNNLPASIAISATASPAPGPGITYTWQPGGLTGASQVVSPTSTTIYVVEVQYPTCIAQATVGIIVNPNCCPTSTVLGANTLTGNQLLTGSTLSGYYVINQNMTLAGTPGMVTLQNAEFVMAPGVKITVPSGYQLRIRGTHLYACTQNMWQGIEVLNGGKLQCFNNSGSPNPSVFIEDAMVAADLDNITSAAMAPPLDLNNVLFNRNYTSIRIRNGNVSTLQLVVRSCVFTSRNIPYSGLSWPGTTATSPDLRYSAAGAMTGLPSPCLLNSYAPANLKSPCSSQPSQYGILISNMNNVIGGATTAGVDIGVFYPIEGNTFNLFDRLGTGIDVTDASLTTMGNIFQDMQTFNTLTGAANGIGIRHSTTGMMNARLDLQPVMVSGSLGQGNYFWNCYKGVEATNVYEIFINNGIYRSMQNTSNVNGYLPGAAGIDIKTNRYRYDINNNQFNNLNNAVNMEVSSGQYNMGSGNQNGIYGANSFIFRNYFGPQVNSATAITNQYLNNAITVKGPNSNNTNISGAMQIRSNKINRSFRGILVDGMDGFPIDISGNLVTLNDDITFSSGQYGIEVDNTKASITVTQNTMSATGTNNTLIGLANFKGNQGGASPRITCNILSNAYQGFVFSGNNPGTIWRSNIMSNHKRGMSLLSAGFINIQGNMSTPIDNEWQGPWTGTNYCTFVDASSAPVPSRLWCTPSGLPYAPVNNNGTTPGNNYSMGGAVMFVSGGNNRCTSFGTFPQPPTNREQLATGLEQTPAGSFISGMFPNPTSGKVNIITMSENELLNVNVVDVAGKLLLTTRISSVNYLAELDLPFEAGVYFIQVTNENKTAEEFRKLIIAH